MDWIEVTAKTVEAAKELALDRLGVVESELEYEVVAEPRGFLRRSDARIRARVKPVSREKPPDRRRRRAGERQGARRTPRDHASGEGERPAAAAEGKASGTGSRATGSGGTGSGRSRSRRRGRGGGGGGGRAPAAPAGTVEVEEHPEADVDVETLPIAEQADFARDFASELVEAMGLRATVRVETDEDDLDVLIEGDDLGVLVGPRGVTLQAVEEVVRAALMRRAGGHSARAHVDVGGYRRRRREALAEFTGRVAAEVIATGRPRSLEPMGAADRKVVHDAAAEIDGVSTGSEGEDPRRRVVIRPAEPAAPEG
jgi:spoIIIJ-associated protein